MFDTQKICRTQPTDVEVTNTMILQRVEFLDGRLNLFSNDTVTSWDSDTLAAEMVSYGVAALRFSTEACVLVDLGNESVTGRVTVARSGTYFINGRVFSLHEARSLDPEVAKEMQSRGWSHFVNFAHGGSTSFNPDTDHIVTV